MSAQSMTPQKAGVQPQPPNAAGHQPFPSSVANLRTGRQGTASPRLSGASVPQVPISTMGGQRPLGPPGSGQMMPPSQSSAMPQMPMNPQMLQTMNPQQRHMFAMHQQQAQLGRQMSGSAQSPPAMHNPQFSQTLQGQQQQALAASGRLSQSFGQQGQLPQQGLLASGGIPQNAGTMPQWNPAMGGYVSSPLNPGWSPQQPGMINNMSMIGNGGGMSASSPASNMGTTQASASPAYHPDSASTPRHSGATPQPGMAYDSGAGIGGGSDYGGGGIDPATLFNDWTTGNV